LKVGLYGHFGYPETLTLFYLNALRSLGHKVAVNVVEDVDVSIVVKFGADPRVLKGVKVLVWPDPVAHENYADILDRYTPFFEHIFFCDLHPPDIMERYNAKFLPFAVCRWMHYPVDVDERDIKVLFVGTNRPGREFIPNVPGITIYGNEWAPYIRDVYDDTKRWVYARSKIILNNHYLGVGPNERTFQALGMRRFMLTDWVPGMDELGFENYKHFVIYDGFNDLIDKIRYYIKNWMEREEIAEAGYKFVMKNHTYEKRLTEMLTQVVGG